MAGFFSKLASPGETIQIACYHCAAVQAVGRKAMTVTCRQCHKPLQVSDVQVKRYDARREVKTVGTVVVEKKGQIVADNVVCGGLVARGQIKAKHSTIVRGLALVGPKADLTGNVEAFTLTVADGAQLVGHYCVGKDHMIAPPPPPPPPPPLPAPLIEQEAFPPPQAVDRPTVKPPPAPIRNGALLLQPRGFASTSGGRTRG